MAGAPVPVPTSSDSDEKILSIGDLEKAASKKLGRNARGNGRVFVDGFGLSLRICQSLWLLHVCEEWYRGYVIQFPYLGGR